MEITTYQLHIEFVEPLLGTQPQKEVALEYITSKISGDAGELPEDEVRTLPEELERGTTAFHKLDGAPILYDYQIKGFLKEAASVFNGLRGVKNLRSKVENLVFIVPRQIMLELPPGGEITYCERALRAQTAQGPRTALARSEQLPPGTQFDCRLEVYAGPVTGALLADLLSYGGRKGMGQWRNGGYGRFAFTLAEA